MRLLTLKSKSFSLKAFKSLPFIKAFIMSKILVAWESLSFVLVLLWGAVLVEFVFEFVAFVGLFLVEFEVSFEFIKFVREDLFAVALLVGVLLVFEVSFEFLLEFDILNPLFVNFILYFSLILVKIWLRFGEFE